MAMLRSIKLIGKIGYHSRGAVPIASCHRQFGEILKCGYTTRMVQKPFDDQLRWVKSSPVNRNADLKSILANIQTQKVTSMDSLNILRCCGREGTLHTELIDDIWAVLKKKVTLDVSHYNALLHVYNTKEIDFDPVNVLEEMLNANIEPNRATFNHLIRAFAIQGNVDNLINVLEKMKSKGIPVNEFTYNNLILAFANDGNVDKMHEIVDLMKEKGFSMQTDTLNALLKGYATTGRIEDINRTFDRFRELKIVLLNADVLDVIYELHAHGHVELIDTVVSRLYKSIEFQMSLKSIVVKAVHKNADGLVHKLLSTFDETDRITLAQLYLDALREAPAEKVDEAVKVLESHGITLQTHPSVFEAGLQTNSPKLIRTVLDDMKAKSVPLEPKNFWKLIELESANGSDAVLNVVHSMKKDYNVETDVYTIRDVVLPSINAAADPHLAYARLRTVESSKFKIARSLIERCLLDKNMIAAYEIAKDHRTFQFNWTNLQNSLIDAFVATGDVRSFAKLINISQQSLASFENRRSLPETKEATDPDPSSSSDSDEESTEPKSNVNQIIAVGNVLRETIARIKTKPQQINALLRAFVQEGLSISPECAHKIKIVSGNALNDNDIELLSTLSSGELSPVLLDTEEKHRRTLDLLSSDELQKMIEIENERGRDTIRLQKILFNAYIREKNVAKVNELVESCAMGLGDHRDIINMHLEIGNTEQLLDYLNAVRKNIPNFKLLRFQTARLARAMFNEKREWSDIVRLFAENKQDQPETGNLVDIRRLLGAVTSSGNAEQLNELVNALIENNFMVLDNRTAGLLVSVHLANKDLPAALQTFENQFKEKGTTAGKVPLMKALIEANDMEKLQEVFDMVLSKSSEGSAVLLLAQSFIEVGNIRQARVVLKNNLLRNSQYSFRKGCEYFYEKGEYTVLKGLLEATYGLEYDRRDIYYYLLQLYCKENKSQEALELWHKQLDQDEVPTNQFLQTLASHLNKKGIEVPFDVPTGTVEPVQPSKRTVRPSTPVKSATNSQPIRSKTPKVNLSTQELALKNAIQQEETDIALELWEKIDSNLNQYVYLSSGLVQLLSKNNRNAEAVSVVTRVVELKKTVNITALSELTQRLVENGDLQLLDRLSDSLPRHTKRNLQLGNANLNACEASGKWNEFFQNILAKTENASAETIDKIDMGIQSQKLLEILQNQSIPLKEFEEFAWKAAEKGVCRPLNVLWAHYFLSDSPDSRNLYDRLQKDFTLNVAFLGRYLVNRSDEGKLQKLKEIFQTENPELQSKLDHVILESHIKQNRIQDALAMIEDGSINVDTLPRNLLSRLKNRIVANGDRIPVCFF